MIKNKKILQLLRDEGYLTIIESHEEEYKEYKANPEGKDYIIYKFQITDQFGKVQYTYEKYLLEDLDEENVQLYLQVRSTTSLKYIEKYQLLFYTLTVISLTISLIYFVILLFIYFINHR